MKKTTRILALVLALVMCLALCACGEKKDDGDTAAESDLAYVQDKGSLVVGITDFAPMDYQDENGNWIGFDADLATLFAESIGVEVQFVEIEWDNKIMELDGKSIDCVWNGMTLTDEVLNAMACSAPYCNNAQVVVLNKDVADQYTTEESLADLKFAVESGSAGEAAVKELGFEYTAVTAQSDALMEVAAGTSDACVIDLLMAGAMTGEGTSYPDLTYTDLRLTSEQYGVGFRQGSDLAAKLNAFLTEQLANGTLEQLAETYKIPTAAVTEVA
ncbi:MAG: transporter substrate-binding domain-containing protein [Oscillospiraceae bacterium]